MLEENLWSCLPPTPLPPSFKAEVSEWLPQANTCDRHASFIRNSVLRFLKIVANILGVDFTLKSRLQILVEKSSDLEVLGDLFTWLWLVGVLSASLTGVQPPVHCGPCHSPWSYSQPTSLIEVNCPVPMTLSKVGDYLRGRGRSNKALGSQVYGSSDVQRPK